MSYRHSYPASMSHEERMKYRDSSFGPFKGVEPEVLQDGSAIYIDDEDGLFYLRVYVGKALRVHRKISGYYRTAERRADVVERFKQARARHHTAKLLRRQAVRKPHTLKVGDVLNTCWGYDQTSVEFYEVIAVSGIMVTLREIAATLTQTGFMCGETTPKPGHFVGEPIRRRASDSNHVRIHACANASPWNGFPKLVSWDR